MGLILQLDNSSKFKNKVVDGFLAEEGVKPIHSLVYTPQSQGAVERTNQMLKHMIFQQLSLFNTKKWADVLPALAQNYNTAVHSTTKMTPNDLHNATAPSMKASRERRVAIGRIVQRAETMVQERARVFAPLKKGDWVRVHLNSDASKFRKQYKAQWSQRAYTVAAVSRPANTALTQPTYLLATEEGKRLSGRFGRGQLLKVPPPAEWNETQAVRPDFSNGKIFDREGHLRRVQAVNREVRTPSTPRTPAPTPTRPGTRSTTTLPTAGGKTRYEQLVAIDPTADYSRQYKKKKINSHT